MSIYRTVSTKATHGRGSYSSPPIGKRKVFSSTRKREEEEGSLEISGSLGEHAGGILLDEKVDPQRSSLDREETQQVEYFLTKLLTGHEYFREYLLGWIWQRVIDVSFVKKYTPRRTVFVCVRWDEARTILVSPCNLFEIMLLNKTDWKIVVDCAVSIIGEEEIEGSQREGRS